MAGQAERRRRRQKNLPLRPKLKWRALEIFLPWPAYEEFQKAHAGYLTHNKLEEAEHGERAFALHCLVVGIRSVAQALKVEEQKGNLVQPAVVVPKGMVEAAERLQAMKAGR